ncbi:Transposase IS116/IS110/IS902 family protein [Bacillus sp. OV194]|nr:Transposase IS116/IS110/IS902 family protein [Bacillus sp. OV194]
MIEAARKAQEMATLVSTVQPLKKSNRRSVTKLQFQSALDQVFPLYIGVFGDLYSFVSLLTLLEFPTSQIILEVDEETITDKINELWEKDIEEYTIIQSIPGIGEKIAATIISEIGEIERFDHPKKLVAFAGIDPSIFQSGKFKGTVNRITKRGSSRLRHALYMAVRCAIRDCRNKKTTDELLPCNKKLREFYDKKHEEGKPFKVVL